MKHIIVFWNLTSCTLVKVGWRAGETCRIHIKVDEDIRFLRNIGKFLSYYPASHSGRQYIHTGCCVNLRSHGAYKSLRNPQFSLVNFSLSSDLMNFSAHSNFPLYLTSLSKSLVDYLSKLFSVP